MASRSGLLSGAGRSGKRDNLRVLQGVQIVGPFLHHAAAVVQVLRMVVSGAHAVAWGVCQLPFYGLMQITLFVQDG